MPRPPQPVIFVDPVAIANDLENQKEKVVIVEEKPPEIKDVRETQEEIKPVVVLTMDETDVTPAPPPILKQPEIGQAFDVKDPIVQKTTTDLVSLGVNIRVGLNSAGAEVNRSVTAARYQSVYQDFFAAFLPALPENLRRRVIAAGDDSDFSNTGNISGAMVQEMSAIAEELAAEQLEGIDVIGVGSPGRRPEPPVEVNQSAITRQKVEAFIRDNGVALGVAAAALFLIRR